MHTYKDGQRLADNIMQMDIDKRPDAIFAGSDEVACGLIANLTARVLRFRPILR
jgi:DNA-binding LacI/PurR family transcriptional regulator